MNAAERTLAEKIIALHKDHRGTIDETFMDYADHFNLSYSKIALVLKDLERQGYIYKHSEYITRLTNEGWQFVSFEDEKIKRDEANRLSKLSVEKLHLEVEELRNKMFDYDDTKRRTIRNERLTFAAVGIALITLLNQLLCNKYA